MKPAWRPTRVTDEATGSDPSRRDAVRYPVVRRLLAIMRSPVVRIAFLAAMIGLLVFTLVDQGPKFWHHVRSLPLWVVLLAFVANIAAYLGSMLVWRASLRILGS